MSRESLLDRQLICCPMLCIGETLSHPVSLMSAPLPIVVFQYSNFTYSEAFFNLTGNDTFLRARGLRQYVFSGYVDTSRGRLRTVVNVSSGVLCNTYLTGNFSSTRVIHRSVSNTKARGDVLYCAIRDRTVHLLLVETQNGYGNLLAGFKSGCAITFQILHAVLRLSYDICTKQLLITRYVCWDSSSQGW